MLLIVFIIVNIVWLCIYLYYDYLIKEYENYNLRYFFFNKLVFSNLTLMNKILVIILIFLSFKILLILYNIFLYYFVYFFSIVSILNYIYLNCFCSFFLLSVFFLFWTSYKYFLLKFFLNFEYIILFMYNILSLILIIYTLNFFTLFLLLEIFSYTIYILIAIQKNFKIIKNNLKIILNPYAIEASLKYFLLGSFNSIFFLLGLMLMLSLNVDLNYFKLQYYFFIQLLYRDDFYNLYIYLSICFFLIYFFFKLSIFPFHWWIPDVFSGSSLFVTSYLAVSSKIIFIFLFFMLFNIIFKYELFNWMYLGIFCSGSSMLFGSICMLNQTNIKRLLAFSTINHMGYVLLGFVLNNIWGIYSAFIYLFSYVITSLLFFILLLNIFEKKKHTNLIYVNQIKYVFNFNFFCSIIIVLILFSWIGIPPLAGFWGKYYILISVFMQFNELFFKNFYIWFWILICIFFSSIFSSSVYLRLIIILIAEGIFRKSIKIIFLKNLGKKFYFSLILFSFIVIFFIYFCLILYNQYLFTLIFLITFK